MITQERKAELIAAGARLRIWAPYGALTLPVSIAGSTISLATLMASVRSSIAKAKPGPTQITSGLVMATEKIKVPVAPPKPIRAPVIPTMMEQDRKKKHPRQEKHKGRLPD